MQRSTPIGIMYIHIRNERYTLHSAHTHTHPVKLKLNRFHLNPVMISKWIFLPLFQFAISNIFRLNCISDAEFRATYIQFLSSITLQKIAYSKPRFSFWPRFFCVFICKRNTTEITRGKKANNFVSETESKFYNSFLYLAFSVRLLLDCSIGMPIKSIKSAFSDSTYWKTKRPAEQSNIWTSNNFIGDVYGVKYDCTYPIYKCI